MTTKKTMENLFVIGRVFSPIYSMIMLIRAWLYEKGILKSASLDLPVVCVGNLTMGGTGKTPMVAYLAKLFSERYRPAVVSRGYGGQLKTPVNVVSDGNSILLSAYDAGDEPVLLAESLPGVPVVTGVKRTLVGKYIADNKLAGLLILDDGYQHLALNRDLNVVLFSAHSLLGNQRVFPGGVLREPVSALRRADCFVLTGVEDSNQEKVVTFRKVLAGLFPQTPIFEGRYQPKSLMRVDAKGSQGDFAQIYPLAKLHDVPLLGFCGIANPDSFKSTLTSSFRLNAWTSFADHHPFSEAELADIVEKAESSGCEGIIMTEKDYVKIREFKFLRQMPFWVLQVCLVMEKEFDDFVLQTLEDLSCSKEC